MAKECENCGQEMHIVREVVVCEGIELVVYRCPFCSEYGDNGDDFL